MRIYLTGFMGAGKTTVGRALASMLDWTFYDLDREIERIAKRSIPELFQSGENAFRATETEQLLSLLPENAVIATGGGCFIENSDWMLNHGKVIYLHVPFMELVQRVGGDPNRPLWKNAAELFEQRQNTYRKAHFEVDGLGAPESIAEKIRNLVVPEHLPGNSE